MSDLVQDFILQIKKNEYPMNMQISSDCIIPDIEQLTPPQHAYLIDRLLENKDGSMGFMKLLLLCTYTPRYEKLNEMGFNLLDRILSYKLDDKIGENHVLTAISIFLSQQDLEQSRLYLERHPELDETPISMFRDICDLLSTKDLNVFQAKITKAGKSLEFFYDQVKTTGTVSFCAPYIFFDVFSYLITSYSRLKNPIEHVSKIIAQLLYINPMFFYSFHFDAKPGISPFDLIPLSTIAQVGMPLPINLLIAYQRIYVSIYDAYLSAIQTIDSEKMMVFLLKGVDVLSTGMAAKDAFAVIGRQLFLQQNLKFKVIHSGLPGWPALASFIIIGLHHNITSGAVAFISEARSDLSAIVASIMSRLRHENSMLAATYSVLDGIMGRRRSPGIPSLTDMAYLTFHHPDRAQRDHGLPNLLAKLAEKLDSSENLFMFYIGASALLSSSISPYTDINAVLDIVSIVTGTSPTSNLPCIRRNWRDLTIKQAVDNIKPEVIVALLSCGLISPRRFVGALAVCAEILRRNTNALKQVTILELLKRAALSEFPVVFLIAMSLAQHLRELTPELIVESITNESVIDQNKRSPIRLALYLSVSAAAKANPMLVNHLIVPDFYSVYDSHHPAIAAIFARTVTMRNPQEKMTMVSHLLELSKEMILLPHQRRISACLFICIMALPLDVNVSIPANSLPMCEESDLVFNLIAARTKGIPLPEGTELVRHATEPLLWLDTLTMEGDIFPL